MFKGDGNKTIIEKAVHGSHFTGQLLVTNIPFLRKILESVVVPQFQGFLE